MSNDTKTPAQAAAPTAAQTARTRAVVDGFLSRIADPQATPESIAALYGDTVDWMCAENPVVPWLRPRTSREGIAAHWRELGEHTVPGAGGISVDAVVVEGAEAVLTGRVWGTVRATGKEFRSPFAVRFTVENDRIVRHHVYEDGVAVAAACTPDDPAA
ncbi:nuclear transport factor 2 family protein [Streptomyces sp. MST-110588]|uniref:nuclear transport factor 2 family protein n=1 Tax=Streptomyces sp. MST-110588 TaxID=2833628 RepID=UPI001F5DD43F|nr:nuclear transport factor 2 family protein [Streptomyces sp. MST-110588]UNO40576.1 nuclear transport factor 2 family protein [Streptomyces sp. MST-110588]